MPTTLFQPSPLSRRLAVLRRVPFWAQALALCALFAIVGVAVLDDYGGGWDEPAQRRNTAVVADYALGVSEQPPRGHNRYYGVAFEMPLLLAERALGLQDSRHIYLTRHLLSHLFFIAGGFICGLLAYRMLGSRRLALFAMLMFLLHPRLYANSFFNSKDVPFAVAMLIALYLTHRAFRRDTIGAFLLCGIGVGLAINLRVFGLMLMPMILAMRALDLWQAGRAERKRILLTNAVLLAATAATAYIVHPYYWENPLRFIEGIRILSQHPTIVENLFMGEIYKSDAVPWNYIPVWFAITAPPVALALGALGAAAVCWQATTRPIRALRDRETRFRILLLGCVAMPVAAAIILQANTYSGWRHMYFLWGPFCLIAAVGLHTIANIRMECVWKVGARFPNWVRGGGNRLHMARRPLAYGTAGFGLLTTLTAMAALHPHQQVYFNALVDTKTPGALGERYDIDYWRPAQRQSLEHLLARYPDGALRVWPPSRGALLLPQNDRERIVFAPPHEADFYVRQRVNLWNDTEPPAIHSVRAYGSGIAFMLDPGSHDYRAYHRSAYHDVVAKGNLLARADFDVYAYDGALRYLNENCAPLLPKASDLWIFLHIFPDALGDLPASRREFGFENRDFKIIEHGAFFDDKCILSRSLPDYPIARISTGQQVKGELIWRRDIDLATHAAAQAVYDSIAAGDYGAPVAQSHFDVYLRGNTLAYLKEPCAPGDTDANFFLHITPANLAALPADRRENGFANLDFRFADHGAYAADKCVAERELPAYPIARIRTGQKTGAGNYDGWRADIDLTARAAAQAAYDSIAAGDYGAPAAQSRFDLYLSGNTLAYLKEPCADSDANARFFLHIIPADVADLPADRRERGFANLDFHFANHGARIGDKCVAERKLPGYAIERIRTGQFVSGEGAIWRVEFSAAQ